VIGRISENHHPPALARAARSYTRAGDASRWHRPLFASPYPQITQEHCRSQRVSSVADPISLQPLSSTDMHSYVHLLPSLSAPHHGLPAIATHGCSLQPVPTVQQFFTAGWCAEGSQHRQFQGPPSPLHDLHPPSPPLPSTQECFPAAALLPHRHSHGCPTAAEHHHNFQGLAHEHTNVPVCRPGQREKLCNSTAVADTIICVL